MALLREEGQRSKTWDREKRQRMSLMPGQLRERPSGMFWAFYSTNTFLHFSLDSKERVPKRGREKKRERKNEKERVIKEEQEKYLTCTGYRDAPIDVYGF